MLHRQSRPARYSLRFTMKKPDDGSSTTDLATLPTRGAQDLTSDAIDYVNAGGAMTSAALALISPIAAAAIGGVTALGALLGARGMQKQVDAIAASVRYLHRRLDEAGARVRQKLEHDDVVEVVSEAIKDSFATSYASNRRRIADVLVNGLEQDADTRTLRMFEKAAASLDDTAIEVLQNLALPWPEGEFNAPHVRAFSSERRRVMEGPFGPAAVSELVRFGLVHPEEIADEIAVDPESEEVVVGAKLAGMKGDLDRTPPRISETGRRFLAWVRIETTEPEANA
jgi:hypothetical protein